MKSYKAKPHMCPDCHSVHDATTGVNMAEAPQPGDISLCINCGEICEFTEEMTIRRVSPEVRSAPDMFLARTISLRIRNRVKQ